MVNGGPIRRDAIRGDLERCCEWAKQKLAGQQEPPWAWYQYMRLRDVTETIIQSMDASVPIGEHRQDEAPILPM